LAETPDNVFRICRRAFASAALNSLLMLSSRGALAQQKMTKAQAEYQDEPKGILMCGTCSLFIRPAGCKVVEGDVAVTGWCKLFDLAD